MSDTTPARKPRAKKPEVIEEAVVVEEVPGEPEVVVVEESAGTVEPTPESIEPELAQEPLGAEPSGPQVIYVHTPPPPTRKGNRGVGAAIAVASGLIFFAVFAIVVAFINLARGAGFTFDFLGLGTFYLPTLFFVLGFVLLVVVTNRASWWAYIFGSILVALFVYFATIGAVMLSNGAILRTPEEAARMFEAGLVDPIVIAAALIAREVSLWTGAIISRRGRRLVLRNAAARDAWEREVADTKAEVYERTVAGSSTS